MYWTLFSFKSRYTLLFLHWFGYLDNVSQTHWLW